MLRFETTYLFITGIVCVLQSLPFIQLLSNASYIEYLLSLSSCLIIIMNYIDLIKIYFFFLVNN